MFCFRVNTLLAELRSHAPQLLDAVTHCMRDSRLNRANPLGPLELDATGFEKCANISIDYALLEKSTNVVVVACEIGWNDIGSWNAVSDLVEADDQGNRVIGDVLLHNVANSYLQSDERLIGAVGVTDLIVVDTPDALLVAHRDCARMCAILSPSSRNTAHRLHRTVGAHGDLYRAGGRPRFKIERIVVKPGASLSLQMHHHRSEHWIVVSGMAKVVNGERELLVNCNESTFIPAGHKHRLENPDDADLVIIEVQSGDYVGEDDIVRFDDRYGRV